MSEEVSHEKILRDYTKIQDEYGEINRRLIEENTSYPYEKLYNYFDDIHEVRIYLTIINSEYLSYDEQDLCDFDSLKRPMIELLEKCEKQNGKVTTSIARKDDNIPNQSAYTRIFGSFSIAKLRADIDSSSIVHLTDEQLKDLEDEMIEDLRRCKDKHGNVSEKKFKEMDTDIKAQHIRRHFGNFSKGKIAALDDPGIVHKTDEEMDRINSIPEDNKHVQEIIKGLLMSDAYLGKTVEEKRNNLEIEMTNREFLEWVADQLGDLVSIIHKSRDSEQIAEKNRRNGYVVNEENIEDQHLLSTVTTDYTTELREKWYPDGEKRFPSDLELTPEITRMWYAGDGSLVINEYCVIYSANENHRPEFLESLFDDTPFNPSFTDSGGGALQFTRSESRDFLDWLGDPVPGFEYKWNINK